MAQWTVLALLSPMSGCLLLVAFDGKGGSWLSVDIRCITEGCKNVKSCCIKFSHLSCPAVNSANAQSSVRTSDSCCTLTDVVEASSG